MINIPFFVQNVINTLENAGFEAYAVGGCVRDILLSKEPDDYDITTDALPEDIKSLFNKTADTGIKHGTVTVITEDGTPIEVTTYRTESGYNDMRHPKDVRFVKSLKEDLLRRDFTVNAIAFSESRGFTDYFGGKDDINRRILRAVGNPSERFFEDALRILRLFRFASTLGFRPERKTKAAALKLCENLNKISAERVFAEIRKAVMGENVNALTPLIKNGGLKSFGILNCKNLKKISLLPKNENLRLFAFFKLCNADFDGIAKNLKLSGSIKNYLKDCEKLLFLSKKSSPYEIKFALSLAKPEILYGVCDYKTFISGEDMSHIKEKAESIIISAEPYKISHLKIDGNDLLKCGKQEKEIGTTLEELASAVRKNPELNTKEQLLNLINQ